MPATRRAWLGLAVLMLPTLLVALDIGVVFLALPAISVELGASGVQQLWLTDVYGFLIAGFLITMGTLGDRIGRRKLLLIGAAAFGVLSIVAAFAPDAGTLIVTRALLGIAGATLMPSTLALISTLFPDAKQRGTAISLWALCQFGGAALGPVLGGVLLAHFWWGSVFLLGAPVMLMLLVAGPLVLPEHRGTGGAGGAGGTKLDPASVVLSLATVLPAVWGIKELATGGGTTAALAVLAGLGFGVAFVRRQRRLTTPLLDLSLFRRPQVGAILATMLLTGLFMAGTGMLVSQYFQLVLGLSPLTAALWYAPMGLAIGLGCVLTPAIVRRVSPRAAITAGLVLGVGGFALVAFAGTAAGLLPASAGLAVVAFGDGPLVALGTGMIVGSVPPERAGSAASTSETCLDLGATLGMALLGSLAAAVYRARLVVPSGVDVDRARESLAGAETVGSPALTASAHAAFGSGLSTVAWVSAVAFAVLSVVAGRALKRRERQSRVEMPSSRQSSPSVN
ncbi:MFS transporter [Amycolatopsis sp. DSM 110486]|uniref:MFS transporter n=1 Tax=Amycolatopsis sp. DSM 110486 TaxID=2865832 RepID=UPI001C69853A|nr:MFS transporter [Amycolatopsis sp. DSM 110486]QYN21791.1 MFS transporter [Amycolatopsis sp. DSM 110486]